MYNACVYQQPPDVDQETNVAPSTVLHPSSSFSEELEHEGAWTNSLVWLTTNIMHFCFRPVNQDIHERSKQWRGLNIALEEWQSQRPKSFEPIWAGATSETINPFPRVVLTADWHGKYLPDLQVPQQ